MSYSVKEIYYTLQGEGVQAGRPAVFLRFTGCNLWSGREEDRARGQGSCAAWCDTAFVGVDGRNGGTYRSADELADAVAREWPSTRARPFVVCTGGEPLLQLDERILDALRERDFEIAVETNGTRELPSRVDWVCVSPKVGAEVMLRAGDELKLVFPQPGAEPERFEEFNFRHFLLQPLDDASATANTAAAAQYCLEHPHWRLTLQTHKILGIP